MPVATITVLQLGSQGPEVADLQHLLIARGGAHPDDIGKIDGIFGPRTHAAVLHLSAHLPFRRDGVVDQDIWEALAAVSEWPNQLPGHFVKRGDRGTGVRRLQQGLKRHRLYSGQIDGDFGPITHRAVMQLQRIKQDSNQSGVVGPMTFMDALG